MNNTYKEYRINSMGTRSNEKLVEMLYEGILRFSGDLKRSIKDENIEKKIYYVNRLIDIFSELINSLDYEKGGDVAHYLSGLYTHQIKILSQANITDNIKHVDTVIRVAKGLLEAWREVNETKLA